MHHKQDEDQILSIVVSFEEAGVFVYNLTDFWGVFPSIDLIDHYLLWYVQEGSHGRYITGCQHSH